MTLIRESLPLDATQWQHLDELARRLGAVAPTGKHARQPSWRTLIRRLADGEYDDRLLREE